MPPQVREKRPLRAFQPASDSIEPSLRMRWIVDLKGEQPLALSWAREFFSDFDTSQLAWVRIDRGRGRCRGAYGRCWYPTRRIPFYRISVQVPGPFPHELPVRRSPVYLASDGSHPPLPPGTRPGIRVKDLRTGREWIRVVGFTRLNNLDEAIVWILAHEAFHFLRRTRQVAGRNTEIHADRFADETLRFFLTGG
ncbi:MAG: hypothetical protein JW929_07175 [Anaerolineales bacterium]|nr:hypothetical protein [Anaerolineales bacterium]